MIPIRPIVDNEITKIDPMPGTAGWFTDVGSYVTVITEKESKDMIARGVKYIVYKGGEKTGYEYVSDG